MIKVSIILPAYNAAETIGEAMESMIRQTWTDWELIVINDGSKDKTKDVILDYTDERIRYIENDGNKGLIYTLNRGLELATGEYIARMDADDISLPERLQKQVDYMDAHPKCAICGTWFKTFGENIEAEVVKLPIEDSECKQCFPIRPPFAHPAVMIRKSIGHFAYDPNYKDAEDYKLWIDLMDKGEYHNIGEVLLHYRISATQISHEGNTHQDQMASKCRWLYIERVLPRALYENLHRGITADAIRKVRAVNQNPYLLNSLYLSQDHYGIRELWLYLTSGDLYRLGLNTTIRYLKRMIYKKAPYLLIGTKKQ